jgi:hypothetical protein
MLVENEDVISFLPGCKFENLLSCILSVCRPPLTYLYIFFISSNADRKNGQNVLGRIVVHDRVNVEAKVLQRYFNHSSFASLRRQLNYFSFVRLGKGRQRESTYINEGVVELEDILHLKRRSAGIAAANQEEVTQQAHVHTRQEDDHVESRRTYVESVVPVVHLSAPVRPIDMKHRKKRRRHVEPEFHLPRSRSPENNFISDEENSESRQYIALDLTAPQNDADEIMAGCNALLGLTRKGWN